MNIITVILLVVLAGLGFVFVIRSKIMGLLAVLLKFGFPLLTVLMLLALFVPAVFDTAADFTLRQNGTYEQITQFDDALSPILDLPDSIFGGLDDLFGGQQEEPAEEIDSEGLLEDNLYPTIVSVVSGILRLATIVISILGMVAIIYLSYTLEGSLSAHAMKKRVHDLEARVQQLEQQLSVATGTAS